MVPSKRRRSMLEQRGQKSIDISQSSECLVSMELTQQEWLEGAVRPRGSYKTLRRAKHSRATVRKTSFSEVVRGSLLFDAARQFGAPLPHPWRSVFHRVASKTHFAVAGRWKSPRPSSCLKTAFSLPKCRIAGSNRVRKALNDQCTFLCVSQS